MKELSQATRTVRMKGLMVTLPVREALLLGTGQRKLAAKIVAQLVLPATLDILNNETGHDAVRQLQLPSATALNAASHLRHVERVMTAPMRSIAVQRFAEHRNGVERALAKESSKRSAPSHNVVLDALFKDIDNFCMTNDGDDDSAAVKGGIGGDDDKSPVTPVRTLHSITSHWRTIKCREMTAEELRGWSTDAREAFKTGNTALSAVVRPSNRLDTTVEMMCESVWRALVPVFGTDVAFNVVSRSLTMNLPPADGVKRRRALSGTSKVITEIAIVALNCRAEYEQKLYEHIRLNRHLIFIDVLDAADHESAVRLSRAAMIDGQHARPEMYVRDIDNSGESEREDNLLLSKLKEISSAQMRHLFKNFVSTRLIDIVDSFAVIFLPIRVDEESGDVSVQFADTPNTLVGPERDDYEKRNFIANDSERLSYDVLYQNGCFSDWDVGCQRDECREARRNVNDDRHAAAVCGCLSSWTLAFRLSRDWFVRTRSSTLVVQSAIERALGPFYHVFIGDDNAHDYVPMHIRVYTCQLELALAATSKRSLRLDEQSIDEEQTVLERVKWSILNYAFSGPLHGSAVMCEQEKQQVFTNERGLEDVERTVLISNSSDLYHMMGLRGIDARRVRSNSVHDMLAVVGVEAARMTAINEYTEVMGDDGYVNRAHYALRADVQTRNGGFTPLSAAGLRATPHDVSQSASHRETSKMFVNAALEHRINAPLISPSATVSTANQLARIGTGAVNLMPDVQAIMNSVTMPQQEPTTVIAGVFQQSEPRRGGARASTVNDELAELMALASRSPERSFTDDFKLDDVDDDNAEAAAAGAMFSPPHGPDTDESGTNMLPEPTLADDASDEARAFDDEPIDIDSPTHIMLQQIQEAASSTTPVTPVEDALRGDESESPKVRTHDEDDDVDDKVPGYSPTSPALDNPTSPVYSPSSPAYTPTQDAGEGYNPERPGYESERPAIRTSDLSLLADLLSAPNKVDDTFMMTRKNKVRMW